jgi:hydroxymethylpyrimidine pyrophosphatase-like HAD family hydrolase
VKPGVVALDYDGTIADHGALDPAIRAAILRAHERDITVVLVTGPRGHSFAPGPAGR